MNKLIFLFAITFSVVCHGQTIPKNTNAITITGDFTRSEKIDQIADTFLDSGVIIASIDRELGSITTSPKSFKNGTVTIHVVVRDGKVTIHRTCIIKNKTRMVAVSYYTSHLFKFN